MTKTTLPRDLVAATQQIDRLTITTIEATKAVQDFSVSFHRVKWKSVFARMNFSLLPIRDRYKNREYKRWKIYTKQKVFESTRLLYHENY